MKEKREYLSPEICIITFGGEDIITTSLGGGGFDGEIDDNW